MSEQNSDTNGFIQMTHLQKYRSVWSCRGGPSGEEYGQLEASCEHGNEHCVP